MSLLHRAIAWVGLAIWIVFVLSQPAQAVGTRTVFVARAGAVDISQPGAVIAPYVTVLNSGGFGVTPAGLIMVPLQGVYRMTISGRVAGGVPGEAFGFTPFRSGGVQVMTGTWHQDGDSIGGVAAFTRGPGQAALYVASANNTIQPGRVLQDFWLTVELVSD